MPRNKNKRARQNNSNPDEKDFDEDNSEIINSTRLNEKLTAKKNQLRETIIKCKNIEQPSNKDLMDSLLIMMDIQLDSMTEMASINKTLNKIDTKVENNKQKLESLENLVKSNQEQQEEVNNKISFENFKLAADINFIKQKQLDNDIFISGFVNKPDTNYVITKICEKYTISREEIHSSESWESSNSGSKKGFMILTFKTKTSQLNFRTKRLSMGAPTLRELSNDPVTDAENKPVRISNRLSPENQKIQRQIRQLMEGNKVHSVRFRNCIFELKKDDKTEFIPTPTLQFLNDLMDNNQTYF